MPTEIERFLGFAGKDICDSYNRPGETLRERFEASQPNSIPILTGEPEDARPYEIDLETGKITQLEK